MRVDLRVFEHRNVLRALDSAKVSWDEDERRLDGEPIKIGEHSYGSPCFWM